MRFPLFLVVLCAPALATVAQNTEKPTPAAKLVVELSDGSRIVGIPEVNLLKVESQYASMQIPFPNLSVVEMSGTSGAARLNMRSGDIVSAQISPPAIALQTILGKIEIPFANVKRIRVNGAASKEDMPPGLVLHYTFDADEGERVTDSSDSGHHGKVQGATYTSEGREGGAMSFSGNHQAVAVGNPENLRLQDFTIAAWIKRKNKDSVSTDGGDDGEIFGYGRDGYLFGIRNGGHLFVTKVDNSDRLSSCTVDDEKFHHVAVTKQGARIVFYLDGIAYPAGPYPVGFEFNTDAAVGMRVDTSVNCFFGTIDDVAVFNRPLSAEEIKKMYETEKIDQ